MITSVMQREVFRKPNEIIKRYKLIKDGPFEFIIDIIDGDLVVTEIFEGGIVHRHGGIKVGDKLLATNGESLVGMDLDEIQIIFERAMKHQSDVIEIVVARNISEDDEEITSL